MKYSLIVFKKLTRGLKPGRPDKYRVGTGPVLVIAYQRRPLFKQKILFLPPGNINFPGLHQRIPHQRVGPTVAGRQRLSDIPAAAQKIFKPLYGQSSKTDG